MQTGTEQWQVVADFPAYEVSSLGRVRRAASGSGAVPGRIMSLQTDVNGYACLRLSLAGTVKNKKVGRLVCAAFHGPAPTPRHHAAHLDGDKTNNAASNLAWATPAENEAHKRDHGTHPAGSKHGCSKVDEDAVKQIRSAEGTLLEIGKQFGLSQAAVSRIRNRVNWQHVS